MKSKDVPRHSPSVGPSLPRWLGSIYRNRVALQRFLGTAPGGSGRPGAGSRARSIDLSGFASILVSRCRSPQVIPDRLSCSCSCSRWSSDLGSLLVSCSRLAWYVAVGFLTPGVVSLGLSRCGLPHAWRGISGSLSGFLPSCRAWCRGFVAGGSGSLVTLLDNQGSSA